MRNPMQAMTSSNMPNQCGKPFFRYISVSPQTAQAESNPSPGFDQFSRWSQAVHCQFGDAALLNWAGCPHSGQLKTTFTVNFQNQRSTPVLCQSNCPVSSPRKQKIT